MRYKSTVSEKLDRIDSEVKKLNYTIGVNDRNSSYKHLDKIKDLLIDINTYINKES